MERPQHRNNTVTFILIGSSNGGLCQPSFPCFPSLVPLLSWNLHQAENWKGAIFERTWGDAWNCRNRIEIDVRTTHSCRCRASCLFLCSSKGMDVLTSYQKVSVLPLASPVQQGRTNRSPWVLCEVYFALLKCLSTPAHTAAALQAVFLDASWSLGDVQHCW